MFLFGQLAVNGITIGMVYVLLTAGIVFIISISRIFLIAYGQFYMIGAYVAWAGIYLLKLPFFVSLLLSVLTTGFLGLLSYRFVFQYTSDSENNFLANIVAAIGIMLILGQGGLLVFGTVQRGIPPVFPGFLTFAGIRISIDKVVLSFMTMIVTIILFLFQTKTRIGRGMRAVAFSPEIASSQGINPKAICLYTVGVGTALAGFAGAIMAPSYGIFSDMGNNVILVVLLIAMLGGIDSLIGAVLGGLVVGMVLSFGQYYIGNGVQIILFITVGVIIYFKPGGLLGSRSEEFGL